MKLTLILTVLGAALPTTLASGYCKGHKYAVVDGGSGKYVTIKANDPHCENVDPNRKPNSFKNVCTSGYYSCSPPPIHITKAKVGGKEYSCTHSDLSGSCLGGFKMDVIACCG